MDSNVIKFSLTKNLQKKNCLLCGIDSKFLRSSGRLAAKGVPRNDKNFIKINDYIIIINCQLSIVNCNSGDIMDNFKLIPYGVSSFAEIRNSNMYYIDKTMYIPDLEQVRYAFLLRPRRFGKSLFTAMLHAYYDINYANRFDELFTGTWMQTMKGETLVGSNV